MNDIIEILKDCFHAGRRFENGGFPQLTFDEWLAYNEIEDKVNGAINEALRQPPISRSLPFKRWRDANFYKNSRNRYVKIGHNSDSPIEFTNSELKIIFQISDTNTAKI